MDDNSSILDYFVSAIYVSVLAIMVSHCTLPSVWG